MRKLIILVMLLCLLAVGQVSAQNMSFMDTGLMGAQTVQIYAYNTTSGGSALIGTYNTTSSGISLPAGDFAVLIKPEASTVYTNPRTLLSEGFNLVSGNAIQLLILVFLIALYTRRR